MSIGATEGANHVSGLKFCLIDQDPAVEYTLTIAVADAKRKANALKQAAGMQLG